MTTTPRPTLRRAALAVLAGALIFALGGCFKMDMALKIDNDQVDGSLIFAIDKKEAEKSGQSVEELFKSVNKETGKSLPPGTKQEVYDDGKYYGAKYLFANTPLKEFKGSGSDELSITHVGDEYKVSGEMDMSGSEFTKQTTDPATAKQLENIDIKIAITFPGEVTSHNGQLDGTTVTWSPKIGEKNPIKAVARDSGGAGGGDPATTEPGTGATGGDQATKNASNDSKVSPWLLWGGIGLVVLAVGLALIIWLVRRKPAAAAVSGYPGGYAPHPGATGTPVGNDPYQQQGGYPPAQQNPYQQGGYPPQQNPTQQYPPQQYPPQQNPTQQYPPQQNPPYGGGQ